jgi:MYXO-CTERM domain-containing protein
VTPTPFRRRAAVTAAVVLALVLIGAGPAAAHVEVSAEGTPHAGTGPVTLVFTAESESPGAGIVSMRTQLPDGIAPADVSLVSAPDGWTLTRTADGLEVGGTPLPPGQDAEYRVSIARLPADATELVLPTVQRYSDGREDAWIEPVTDAVPNPERPAPVLTVAPAPPGATSAAPSTTAGETATGSPSAQAGEGSQSTDEDPNPATIVIVAALLALVVVGAVAWIRRARRRA